MFHLLSFLILVVAACSGAPRVSPRIVGGSDADIANYPYTASLERDDSHNCGAAIISAEWVLTDAFCANSPDLADFGVRVGSSIARVDSTDVVDTGTLHSVTEWVRHPLADTINRDYDFALVKVDPPIVFNSNVAAAVLPEFDQEAPEGAVGAVTGWGTTSREDFISAVSQLQFGQLTVVSDARCHSIFNARTLCAEAVDAFEGLCWRDEGNPLVVDGTLIGIAFWTQWCTNPQDLQIFSKVSTVRDWIDTTINA